MKAKHEKIKDQIQLCKDRNVGYETEIKKLEQGEEGVLAQKTAITSSVPNYDEV